MLVDRAAFRLPESWSYNGVAYPVWNFLRMVTGLPRVPEIRYFWRIFRITPSSTSSKQKEDSQKKIRISFIALHSLPIPNLLPRHLATTAISNCGMWKTGTCIQIIEGASEEEIEMHDPRTYTAGFLWPSRPMGTGLPRPVENINPSQYRTYLMVAFR